MSIVCFVKAWENQASRWELIGRRPTLPHTRACSTIGAERLNYRVRDGNGWDPLARITQSLYKLALLNIDGQHRHLFLLLGAYAFEKQRFTWKHLNPSSLAR